mgnify:CR=1 FL=1
MLGRIENSALYGAHVENYAFVQGVSLGADLLRLGLEQTKQFGTELSAEDVLKIAQEEDMFHLELESGSSIRTRSLIFCMGVSKKKLSVPGEKACAGI